MKKKRKVKPTKAQFEQLIVLAVTAIKQGYNNSQNKAALKAKGVASTQTALEYMARARERIRSESDIPIDQLRSESLEFYKHLIRDPRTTIREKILARERFDKIMGLDAPVQAQVGGIAGAPIQISELSDDDTRKAMLAVRGALDRSKVLPVQT